MIMRAAYEAARRERWLRPDADRWLRPDAARFLVPGTDPATAAPSSGFDGLTANDSCTAERCIDRRSGARLLGRMSGEHRSR